MTQQVVPAVSDDEWLARYIFSRVHIRHDNTVKPDAFIPYPHKDLSVNRHFGLSEATIWRIGENVGLAGARVLYGRADVQALDFVRHGLTVVAAPTAENGNHSNVTGWPDDKPRQKQIAQLVAANAQFLSKPDQDPTEMGQIRGL